MKKFPNRHLDPEGYVYVSYGHPKYLEHVIASIVSLRRYDKDRPVALVCEDKHRSLLEEHGLDHLFDVIFKLDDDHASIVGFKHNTHHYLIFEKNLFLDSDIVWCKDPDPLWRSFSAYDFTITGNLISDNFFGAPKGLGVLKDIILRRRKRTLKRFDLTYLSRVQSGMIYASSPKVAKKVNEGASEFLSKKHLTHFQSRKMEKGRSMESCEWSLAMSMSRNNIPVYPWLQGHTSPQLDYISDFTDHDKDFVYVSCKYYSDNFIFSMRGLKSKILRKLLMGIFSFLPGKSDYLMTTPYCLHFGWYHQKEPFYSFSDRTWAELTGDSKSTLLSDLLSRKTGTQDI
ncbi:hypothetical protein AB2B38_000370 [Balneola sp. MJW-20]|uniref:hypothetical protein n=1 Tax=Gracilimonas aurantiaca TaxID=3234185 RepID=UPI00346599BB